MPSCCKLSDSELLQQLRTGDESIFSEIYRRHWKILFAVAYNRVKDIQAAEDIVHDIFTSLWANREKVEISDLKAYLAAAAKYMILAQIKKTQRFSSYVEGSWTVDMNRDYSFEENIHLKHILELLKKEVEKLPEKCKLIFKYSREQHKTTKQIAHELNLSPRTVENQLTKALGKLRIAFKNISALIISILLYMLL